MRFFVGEAIGLSTMASLAPTHKSLTASQENRVYFATFYRWGGFIGPIGAELILEQLRQSFMDSIP